MTFAALVRRGPLVGLSTAVIVGVWYVCLYACLTPDAHSLWSGGCAMCCCAGEGFTNTVLTGPGLVIVQSMSIERIARAIAQYLPAKRGRQNEAGVQM